MHGNWPVPGGMLLALTFLSGCMGEPYPPYTATTYTKAETHYCTLHDRPLRVGSAHVEYGLLRSTRQQVDTEMLHFPNSNSWFPGGCSWDPEYSPDREAVWYCSTCRRAETRHDEAHAEFRSEAHPSPFLDSNGKYLATARLIEVALTRTESDEIKQGWQALCSRLLNATDDAESRQAADGLVRIAKRLESGWPGFIGPIVSLKRDKTPVRQTSHQRLAHCYTLLLLPFDIFGAPPAQVETYLRVEPANADLRKEWLGRSTMLFGEFTSSPARPSVNQLGVDGFTYAQDWGTAGRSAAPARRIVAGTGPNCRVVVTILLDEKRYPAEQIVAAHLAHYGPLLQ